MELKFGRNIILMEFGGGIVIDPFAFKDKLQKTPKKLHKGSVSLIKCTFL